MAVVILSLPSFLLENDFIYHCPPLKWLLYSPSIIVGMKMTSFTIFPFKMAVVLHSFLPEVDLTDHCPQAEVTKQHP